jgi:AbrB family looped-hinge helix DNA binding protein
MAVAEQTTMRVRMDPQGRVVIPAEARRALGAEPGEPLMLTISTKPARLVFESRSTFLEGLHERFGHQMPSTEELLAARAEDAEMEGGAEPRRRAGKAAPKPKVRR